MRGACIDHQQYDAVDAREALFLDVGLADEELLERVEYPAEFGLPAERRDYGMSI